MTERESQIIERIKRGMRIRNVRQEDLGEALGMKQYRVSRILAGKPFPSIDQLFIIAERLEFSIGYLLGVQDLAYQELSKDAAEVALAYEKSGDVLKTVTRRVLDI